jgi:HEAT repeat protein
MKRALSLLIIVGVAIAFSCRDAQEEGINKFSDPLLIKIYDFKDRRLGDSLYQYFSSPNEVYREEAVLAFGSIQDSIGINALSKMLKDESIGVRAAAAFSMGQTRSTQGESLLLEALASETDKSVREELIESYGKVTKRWNLSRMLRDASMPERFSWSIYRAGLRGMAGARLDSAAAILLGQTYGDITRLGAAHYFSRTGKNFEAFESTIINSATNDPSAEVRIASTLALGKIGTESSLTIVRRILKNESDYRVRVSAVRALRLFAFKKIQPDLIYALADSNINVAIAASELIGNRC